MRYVPSIVAIICGAALGFGGVIAHPDGGVFWIIALGVGVGGAKYLYPDKRHGEEAETA